MFDFSAFLKDMFPDRASVGTFLRAYGVKDTPTDMAIQKWYLRRSVPAEWFATLLAYLEIEHGEPIRLGRYIKGAAYGTLDPAD